MISLADLTTELQRTWTALAPANVPTQFPGVRLDASELQSWYEFWVTQAEETPHRVPSTDRIHVLIDIHCFSREPDKRRIASMADSVRAALAHQTLTLATEFPESPATVLRIHDAACRDLTRDTNTEPRLPLQHLVVSLAARAEQVTSQNN